MRERDVFAALDRGEIRVPTAVELLKHVEPPDWWETPAGVLGLVLWATVWWPVWGALWLLWRMR